MTMSITSYRIVIAHDRHAAYVISSISDESAVSLQRKRTGGRIVMMIQPALSVVAMLFFLSQLQLGITLQQCSQSSLCSFKVTVRQTSALVSILFSICSPLSLKLRDAIDPLLQGATVMVKTVLVS